jgi:hypothetical protein
LSMGTRALKGNREVCPKTSHESREWEEIYSSTLPLTSAMAVGDQRHVQDALNPRKDQGPTV